MQLWDGYHLSNVQGSGTGGSTSFYVNDAARRNWATRRAPIRPTGPITASTSTWFRRTAATRSMDLCSATSPTRRGRPATSRRPSWRRGITNVAKVYHDLGFQSGRSAARFARTRCGSTRRSVPARRHPRSWTVTTTRIRAPYLYDADLNPAGDTTTATFPTSRCRLTWQASSEGQDLGLVHQPEQDARVLRPHAGVTPDARRVQSTPYAQATPREVARGRRPASCCSRAASPSGARSIDRRLSSGERRPRRVQRHLVGPLYNNYCPGQCEHSGTWRTTRRRRPT